jgi:hypothetical protein
VKHRIGECYSLNTINGLYTIIIEPVKESSIFDPRYVAMDFMDLKGKYTFYLLEQSKSLKYYDKVKCPKSFYITESAKMQLKEFDYTEKLRDAIKLTY